VTPSPSRRRLLTAAVPGLLAGCLVESGESADANVEANADEEDTAEGDGSAGGDGSADGDDEAASADGAGDANATEQTDGDPAPDEVGPDGAGLVVESAEVLDVTNDEYATTVDARLTVENAGRFTYGTVEFRVDAYPTLPNSPPRDSVGFAYVTRRFASGNRFDDGTRRFDVSITFGSGETSARADPDWYEVDAAVRRAEPV